MGPWGVVAILMVFYALAQFDKRLITMLIEPIRKSIGATDIQMSVLSGTAFVLFYVVFSFPIGWAADRLSRRNIIFGGVISWSVFSALGGFAHNFWLLSLSRFGVGAGEASLMPSAHSIVADLFPREKLARALGVFTLGAFLGAALSLAIGGLLLSHFGRAPITGVPLIGTLLPWQAVLLLGSAPGLPLAMLLFLMKEPVRRRQHALQRIDGARGATAYMLRHKRFYALHFLGFSTLAIMTAGFSSWLPTHMLRTFHEPIARVGLVLATLQLTVGPVGMLLTVRAVDRLFLAGKSDAHMTFYVAAGLVLSFASIVAGLAPNATVAYLGVALFDSLHGGFLPVAGAVIQLVTPAQYRGRATAIFFVCYNVIGQAFGPTAIALSTDLLMRNDALIGASIALVGAIAGPASATLLYASRRSLGAMFVDEENVAKVCGQLPATDFP